jgi:hypothetical protein
MHASSNAARGLVSDGSVTVGGSLGVATVLSKAERALTRLAPGLRRRIPSRAGHPLDRGTGNRDADSESVFTGIFLANAWLGNKSRSGEGSDRWATAPLREALIPLFERFDVRSLLDAPCGDFNWMRDAVFDLDEYVGADIVDQMIRDLQVQYGAANRRFIKADISSDPLPRADLILCRDCLVHMPDALVKATVRNFKRTGSTYLLTTSFVSRLWNARDIALGEWRSLNLEQAPFNFPRPLAVVNERFYNHRGRFADKSLALWSLEAIDENSL